MIYFMKSNGAHVPVFASHVGSAINAFVEPRVVNDVEIVQADGDELDRALALLGRASVPKRVWRFVGDDARTIAANW